MSYQCERFVGQQVTMVCFAEFNCFIHFEGKNYIRIENCANVSFNGTRYELFPNVQGEALRNILGKEFVSLNELEDRIKMKLGSGEIDVRLLPGYESIMIVIDGVESELR